MELVIIQYESSADQSFLVKNTLKIYGYFEDSETGTNAMIGEINQQQKEILLSKGYYIQVVEKNPQINNFVFLHSDIANEGSKLAYLGKVYVITKNDTLVRITDNTIFEHTGVASEFSLIPLKDLRTQIAVKNNVDLTLRNEATTSTPKTKEKSSNNSTSVTLIVVSIIVIIGLLVFMLWRKFKSKTNTNESDNPQIS